MNIMDANQQRGSVKKEYQEKLEKNGGFCAHQLETEYGYSQQELNAVPESASGSSFGCANPLAIGNILSGDTVVDLGSGAGMDVILAAKKVGPEGKVIGVDMTGAMVERARQNIADVKLESIAEIRQGVIESLPLENNSVDWVISNCVISLSPDKEQVFSEVFRVLKPGGKMLLTDLVMAAPPRWLRTLINLKSPASAKAMDLNQYMKTIRHSGLSTVELRNKLDYDTNMLHNLALAELNLHTTLPQALLSFNIDQLISHSMRPLLKPAAALMNGKVSSIKVYAEKPENAQ